MNITAKEIKAAGVILYTINSEHGKLELCIGTYTDGSARDVISGEYEFSTPNHYAHETFDHDTISSVVSAIQDMVTNRYLFYTCDYETEYDEYMDYAECFEFIAHASKQLRIYQGLIEA